MSRKLDLLMFMPVVLLLSGIIGSIHTWAAVSPRYSDLAAAAKPVAITSPKLQSTATLSTTAPALQGPETTQPEPLASFTLINQIDRPICSAYVSAAWQTAQYVERLQGDPLPPGESRSFELPRGVYTVLLRDCSGGMVLFKTYLDIAAPHELPITAVDLQVAPCQEQNYAGMGYYSQGRYVEAFSQFRSALTCFEDVPFPFGQGEALNNIGAVYLAQGRLGDAMAMFNKSLAIAKSEKNLDGESAAFKRSCRSLSLPMAL